MKGLIIVSFKDKEFRAHNAMFGLVDMEYTNLDALKKEFQMCTTYDNVMGWLEGCKSHYADHIPPLNDLDCLLYFCPSGWWIKTQKVPTFTKLHTN